MAGTATPKIYAALQGVMEDIKSLEKNGAAPKAMGGYKFLAVDDVLKEVRPHLVKHKIIVLPQLVNTDNHVIQQDGGRISTKVFLTFDFHFVSTEDGSEVVVTVVGEANDTGDKTVRKATTSAHKIALIQAFTLITGEADEHELADGNLAQEAPAGRPKAPAGTPEGVRVARPKTTTPLQELKAEIVALADKLSYGKDDINAAAAELAKELGKAQGSKEVLEGVKAKFAKTVETGEVE